MNIHRAIYRFVSQLYVIVIYIKGIQVEVSGAKYGVLSAVQPRMHKVEIKGASAVRLGKRHGACITAPELIDVNRPVQICWVAEQGYLHEKGISSVKTSSLCLSNIKVIFKLIQFIKCDAIIIYCNVWISYFDILLWACHKKQKRV